LEGNQVECSDSEFERGQPELLDDFCTDDTSQEQSAKRINSGEEIQVSAREDRPLVQDGESTHPAVDQVITGGNPNMQFQDMLTAIISTMQADKKETLAAIKEGNDRIRDEVKQLERNVRDENRRLIEMFERENAKLRNDLNEKLQIETCKLTKLVREVRSETEQELISVKTSLQGLSKECE
jgi:hypothetical protein